MPKLEEILILIDQLIISGQLKNARRQIRNLISRKPSRKFREPLARLACRADMANEAVLLLRPFVRKDGRKGGLEASQKEKLAYAIALCRIGAAEEGVALLEKTYSKDLPESCFFLALSYCFLWKYEKAIPLLKEYSQFKTTNPYQRLVAEVNLASALVHKGAFEEAEVLFERVERSARQEGKTLLLGKTLYFAAELDILTKNPKRALERLNEAGPLLKESGSLDLILYELRCAFAKMQLDPSTKGRETFRIIRERAKSQGAWEAVRNCDLHEAILMKDEKLAQHLYFGTPSEAFRKTLLKHWGRELALADSYILQLGGSGGKTYDLTSDYQLKTGTVLQRLMHHLCADFYRPLRMVEVFSRIYPGEYYNPASSLGKVKQEIKMFRKWLLDQNLPLKLENVKSTVQLKALEPCGLLIALEKNVDPVVETRAKLQRVFPTGFSAREASLQLEVSYRTTTRLLAVLVSRGSLVRVGVSNQVRYVFPR